MRISTKGHMPREIESLDSRVEALAEFAMEKKAIDLVILDVHGVCSYADYFIICSGRSDRQVQTIAANIEEKMKQKGERPLGVEGTSRGHWVLMDYNVVIVHIFYEPVRSHYDLEGIWPDVPRRRMET